MRSDIRILYENGGLIAVDKPAGLAVHAAPGPGSSVLKELTAQTGKIDLTPVHRLDKDATGVLLLAESKALAAEIQRKWDCAEKTYLALCDGVPAEPRGLIDAPILEHQTGKPERMRNALRYFEAQNPGIEIPPLPTPKTSAVHPAGRLSQSGYALIEAFAKFSLIEARPKQGRMHQIRIHLTHLGHPLAVDPLYGRRAKLLERDAGGTNDTVLLERMPLHAASLAFQYKGETITVVAPLPNDMENAMRYLRMGLVP